MALRIDREWSENISFAITDRIALDSNNQFTAVVQPEDWALSEVVANHGGKVMATKAIRAQHIGTANYSNQDVWGQNIDSICPDANK
jgi:hypothetical protein